jgi:hypothetical protein
VSITLGRPVAINPDDCDVELPSVENERFINSGFFDEAASDEPFNRTAIFVHITKYRILCGKTMRCLHSLKKPEHNVCNAKVVRDELAVELDQWRQTSKDLELPDMDLSHVMSKERSSFRSKEWYELVYNNAVLMLFRPSPMLSDISRDPTSLQKLFTASKQAVNLYSYLHRSRKINYSWITLHSVFMAGLTYIYAVSCHFRETRRSPPSGAVLPEDPSTIEIVNDTRACSNVLVAVSERWNALRHCHEVFDRLSDAVIVDAIKFQCSPRASYHFVAARPSTPLQRSNHMSSQDRSEETVRDPAMQYSTWCGNSGLAGSINLDYYSPSPLAVDSEFRNSFGDLQQLYNQPFSGDPVMQLSQDWLGYIDAFDGMAPLPSGPEFSNTTMQ